MQKETSAGAVLFRKNGQETLFLLLHYQSGHWDFPKGHVEAGETHEKTVKRETEEETGIKTIEILPGFQEKIHYFYMREGERMSKDVFFYVAETEEEKVTLSHEHIGFEWLPFEEAKERLTFKTAKEILEKAKGFLEV